MVEVKTLTELDPDSLRLFASYISNTRYSVRKLGLDDQTVIELELVSLERPCTKRYSPLDEETIQRYTGVLQYGLREGRIKRNNLSG